MEQTIQKPPLPTKTKIAAWWMITIGGFVLLFSFWGIYKVFFVVVGSEYSLSLAPVSIMGIAAGLLIFIPSIFLLKKKRNAWWFLEIILFIGIIFFLRNSILFPTLIILIPPFVLLLFDRKNFWKIAS